MWRLLAVGLGVAGCAPHVSEASTGVGGAGGAAASSSTASMGASGGSPACAFDAPLTTRPGGCNAEALECGADASGVDCGGCDAGTTCFDQRCYRTFGPDAAQYLLLQGFFGDGVGERCLVPESGAIERIEALIWNSGIESVTMEIHLTCAGEPRTAASVTLPGSAFPTYELNPAPGALTPTTFVLDTPVAVTAGEIVDVVFLANGASLYDRFGVCSVAEQSTEPSCHYITPAGDGGYKENPHWDLGARVFVH